MRKLEQIIVLLVLFTNNVSFSSDERYEVYFSDPNINFNTIGDYYAGGLVPNMAYISGKEFIGNCFYNDTSRASLDSFSIFQDRQRSGNYWIFLRGKKKEIYIDKFSAYLNLGSYTLDYMELRVFKNIIVTMHHTNVLRSYSHPHLQDEMNLLSSYKRCIYRAKNLN